MKSMKRFGRLALLAGMACSIATMVLLAGCAGRHRYTFTDPVTQRPTTFDGEYFPDRRITHLPADYEKCGQYTLTGLDGRPLRGGPTVCVWCKRGDPTAPRYIDVGCRGDSYDPIGPAGSAPSTAPQGGKATVSIDHDQSGEKPALNDGMTININPLETWKLEKSNQAFIIDHLYERGVTVTIAGIDIAAVGSGAFETAEAGMQIEISGPLGDVADAAALFGMPDLKFQSGGDTISIERTLGETQGIAVYVNNKMIHFQALGVNEE